MTGQIKKRGLLASLMAMAAEFSAQRFGAMAAARRAGQGPVGVNFSRGRYRGVGPKGQAGDKLARMASERRLGLAVLK